MLNNLFRKTYFSSFFIGAIFIFIAVYFIHIQNSLIDALTKSACFLLIMLGLFFSEKKYRYLGIQQIHILSFSLTLLYLPSQEISYIALFLMSSLLLAYHNTVRLKKSKSSVKALFNLSFIITGISFFEPLLAFLFITPLLSFTNPKHQNIKHLIAFILPIISFFMIFYSVIFAFKIQYVFPWQNIEKFREFKVFTVEGLLWGGFVLFVLFSSLRVKSKEHLKGLETGNYFWLFFIIIGFIIGFIEIESNFKRWGLLYLPLAYLLGIILHYMSRRVKSLVIGILLIARLGVFLT